MGSADFDVKCYFTSNIIPGMGYGTTWYRPYELAYANITTPGVDTIPEVYQYVRASAKHDFDSGLRAPISRIEMVDHLTQGSYVILNVESLSDRDFFEVVPNETVSFRLISGATKANPCVITSAGHQLQSGTNIRITGVLGMTELNNRSYRITVVNADTFELHEVTAPYNNINSTSYHTYSSAGQVSYGGGDMMPRIKFPYRAWEVNLKAKDDASFPTIPLFRGMRTRVQPVTLGDKKIEDQQDKLYQWGVELMSFDTFNLRHDNGAAVWYHRANHTTDSYHFDFNTSHHITFDDAITRVVAWMNQGRPTSDFPITYAYTPKATPPYDRYLDEIVVLQTDPNIGTIVETEQKSTWEILTRLLDYMGGLEGLGKKYLPTLTINEAGTTGTIDTVLGGYDKTHTFNEAEGDTDFRTFTAMEYYDNGSGSHVPTNLLGNGIAVTSPINQVMVMFNIYNTGEYWMQFKLWKYVDNVWTNVVAIPSSSTYEYVSHDVNNTHNNKVFAFPAQDAGTYTWTADILCGDSAFIIKPSTSGSGAYGVAAYTLQPSYAETDATSLRTFVMTRGLCQSLNIYGDPTLCPDFSDGLCPGYFGLYPDPITSSPTSLTGALTFTYNSTGVTGVGTLFTSELVEGDAIRAVIGSNYHIVQTIINNTSLTLASVFKDPCYSGNLTGSSIKMGSTASNEVVNPTYGIIAGGVLDFANISDKNSWDTLCRLNSKRKYECSLNRDSTIREPINVHLEFVDGWTPKVVGKYGKFYDPVSDEDIMFRIIQQIHILQGNTSNQRARLRTIIEGFRV